MRGVLHLNFLHRRAVDWEAAGQRFNGVPSSRVAARVHCHQEAWVFSNFASKTVAASREHSHVSPALFVLFLFMFVCCCSLPITYSTALQGRSGCNRSCRYEVLSSRLHGVPGIGLGRHAGCRNRFKSSSDSA